MKDREYVNSGTEDLLDLTCMLEIKKNVFHVKEKFEILHVDSLSPPRSFKFFGRPFRSSSSSGSQNKGQIHLPR